LIVYIRSTTSYTPKHWLTSVEAKRGHNYIMYYHNYPLVD
jgi:hypothetical protein